MPFFSSSLTKAASENLAGGFVNFLSNLWLSRSKISSGLSEGKSWSSSDAFCLYTFKNPSNNISLPLA